MGLNKFISVTRYGRYILKQKGTKVMKRKITLIAAAAICVSMLAYGTNAFFTAEDKAHNVITTGDLDIELVEMAVSEDGGELVPFEDVIGVMPGEEVSKIVTIRNKGTQPAYVRIKLDKAITFAEGISGKADLSLLSCDLNTKDWTEKDGYFYYNQILPAGKETTLHFENVKFAESMGNIYQNCKAEIFVYAQATQVANNGDAVLEAKGWPAD